MKNNKLRVMIAVAMLSSISFVLMLFNFPLPALPPFLKVDFSDVPALIAAITMGPVAGILVALFKNVLYWFFSGSPTGVPVGEMANFATSILFMLPVYAIYRKVSNTKGLAIGLLVGILAMAIGMSVLNYAVFLPMYTYFLNMPALTGSALRDTIVLGILPFNLIKGLLLSAIIIVLFKTMKSWLDKQRAQFS
ncbi:ECF transporter S component [Paenisporosarcina quisquiliarum]|uniref:Riboflavin transporter n=1 Tax=Paenisporosarcina quisquiliarum TaxID=365346 RepID=A0A9X3LD62_9BACL|nr:ECF transporter S component [Paenisporosarcina quisquiliarum]MCZ8535751.1 ECF transporter S component [Paenisporosarcina quisquiliarum]